MWDEQAACISITNFVTCSRRRYPFLTTFYPLWAGIASREQAARVVRNLRLFEKPGGLQTSTNHSGNQWDAPFGWAPLQMLAVEGLRRYGYTEDADRIARSFLSLVLAGYRDSGRIVEKYDVVRRSANLAGEIRFGYRSNEAGFGWTNAVFTHFWDELPNRDRLRVGAKWQPFGGVLLSNSNGWWRCDLRLGLNLRPLGYEPKTSVALSSPPLPLIPHKY